MPHTHPQALAWHWYVTVLSYFGAEISGGRRARRRCQQSERSEPGQVAPIFTLTEARRLCNL